MADGTLDPLHREATIGEVAVLLNVSPAFVGTLLDEGAVPSVERDGRRQVRLRDVLDYKRRRGEKSARLLGEVLAIAQEHGGYD